MMKLTTETATMLAEQLPDLADTAHALAEAARGWLQPPIIATDPAQADAARVSYADTCEGLLDVLCASFVRCAELVGVEDTAEALRDLARILDELAAGHEAT
jgi:Lon protease-like protein